jgi:hypothetical protein
MQLNALFNEPRKERNRDMSGIKIKDTREITPLSISKGFPPICPLYLHTVQYMTFYK